MPVCTQFGRFLAAESRRVDEAEKDARRALAMTPDQPLLWVRLAGVLVEQRRYSEAEAAARKAIELSSGVPAAWAVLAAVLDATGRMAEAEQANARLIELVSHSPSVLLADAELALRQGDLGRAGSRLDRADPLLTAGSAARRVLGALRLAAAMRAGDKSEVLQAAEALAREAGAWLAIGPQAASNPSEVAWGFTDILQAPEPLPEPEEMLLAAAMSLARGSSSLEYYREMLNQWKEASPPQPENEGAAGPAQ